MARKNMDDLAAGETIVYATNACLAMVNTEEKATAWRMYMDGWAELTQKRLPSGLFEYRLTKRKVQAEDKILNVRKSYYKNILSSKAAA